MREQDENPVGILSGRSAAVAVPAGVNAARMGSGVAEARPAPRGPVLKPAPAPAPPVREADSRPIVVHVMTVPVSLTFLSGQASYMRRAGFELHAIASPGPFLEAFGQQEQIPVHGVPMTRSITPGQDLRALWRLCRELRRIRPHIVHAHTPKGGLLGMLAARLAEVPVRLYHMRGLPFVTATGPRRRLLIATERLSCSLAHRVLAISYSMKAIAVEEGICSPNKIRVVRGGGNGVDAAGRFTPRDAMARTEARARRGIPAHALVIGFVGRLTREKGVVELARAWEQLRRSDSLLHLLIVGLVEQRDGVLAGVIDAWRSDPRVHMTGVDWDTPPLYSAMDVLALPTYREGFPNVTLEAAAMGIPVVATRVPGCVDAVQDGFTGTLVPPRDVQALAGALQRYLSDPVLRARHGAEGRRRALAEFRRESIWEGLASQYGELLDALGDRST